MPSGTYFHGQLTPGVLMATDPVPVNKIQSVNILVINDTASAVVLDVYICTSPDSLAGRRIEPPLTLPVGGLYKLTGEPVSPGEHVALSATGAVTARISGFEESI